MESKHCRKVCFRASVGRRKIRLRHFWFLFWFLQFCFELQYIPLSEPNTLLPSRNEIVDRGRAWLLNESDISMRAKKTNKDGIYVTYFPACSANEYFVNTKYVVFITANIITWKCRRIEVRRNNLYMNADMKRLLCTFRHFTKSVLEIFIAPLQSLYSWQDSIHWSWLFDTKLFTTLRGSFTPGRRLALIWMSGFTWRTSFRSWSKDSSKYISYGDRSK